jgi:hypothetical protein
MRATGYVVTAAVFALLTAGAVAIANWRMDPFGLFGRPSAGFYFSSERDIKQGLVRGTSYDGLLMGSSKVAEWPARMIRTYRVLNAAWSAAQPEEMAYFLDEMRPDVAFVAIGFDVFMFNGREYPFLERSPFGRGRPDVLATHLFSMNMLQTGLAGRRMRLAGEIPRVLPDGSRNTLVNEPGDYGVAPNHEEPLEALRTRPFRDYRFETRRIESLRRIKAWGASHCVALIPFVNPLSGAVLDLIRDVGITEQVARFRRAVRSVFPDVLDLMDVPELAAQDLYWSGDPDHYYPSIGLRIFNEHVEPVLRERLPARACTAGS